MLLIIFVIIIVYAIIVYFIIVYIIIKLWALEPIKATDLLIFLNIRGKLETPMKKI